MKMKLTSKGYYFHPFEIAFCGFSNTGKTTLIESIITGLKNEFAIAYLKHDAHSFCMDHSGKDTHRMQKAGAKNILINDSNHYAMITHSELTQVEIMNTCLDSDILIVEGHKFSALPKFLFIDKNIHYDETLQLVQDNKITDIIGIISDHDPLGGQYPVFKRDDYKKISSYFINKFIESSCKKIKTLILAGGHSKRMNEDKASIHYYGKDQVMHTIDLVSDFSDDIYISCRVDQLANAKFLKGHNAMVDQFPSLGPSSGILSAQYSYPQSAWLVIACDLPYLDKKTIQYLIKNRNIFKNATCFLNPKRSWPEPLCAIYEPKSYHQIMKYFSMDQPCPRKVLFNSNIQALDLENKMALENINTPTEKLKVFEYIQSLGSLYEN